MVLGYYYVIWNNYHLASKVIKLCTTWKLLILQVLNWLWGEDCFFLVWNKIFFTDSRNLKLYTFCIHQKEYHWTSVSECKLSRIIYLFLWWHYFQFYFLNNHCLFHNLDLKYMRSQHQIFLYFWILFLWISL